LEVGLAVAVPVGDEGAGAEGALVEAGLAEVDLSSTGGGVSTVDEQPPITNTVAPNAALSSHEVRQLKGTNNMFKTLRSFIPRF
jgi:hypothetical protein